MRYPFRKPSQRVAIVLVASCLATSMILGSAVARGNEQAMPGMTQRAAVPATRIATASSKELGRHPAGGMPACARQYYAMTWGVDQLSAQLAESGQLVKFEYRIVDAAKAALLHDRASSPQLLDEQARAVLEVPVMEKVGPLRQSTPPMHGKSYWMAFSNKGNVVKSGHRVSVVIGSFRVDGLLVQ